MEHLTEVWLFGDKANNYECVETCLSIARQPGSYVRDGFLGNAHCRGGMG